VRIENLDALSFLKTVESESVDCVYIDPPFNTGLLWSRGKYSFQDKFESLDAYLLFMRSIFVELHRVLKESGSVFVHIHFDMQPYLQIELNNIFGIKNRLNTILWRRAVSLNYAVKYCLREHDAILVYAKNTKKVNINKQTQPLTGKKHNCLVRSGFFNKNRSIENQIGRPSRIFEFHGVKLPKNYSWFKIKDRMEEMLKAGQLWIETNRKGEKRAFFVSQSPRPLSEVWEYFSVPHKDSVYPTAKPLKLLDRIIKSATNENGVVLDCFLGGGTTAVSCKRLNRQFIGCDINPDSIEITNARLELTEEELDKNQFKLF
jgi:DNA modification methylase